ncbi:hypothetical protein NQU59_04695 [Acinetobacter colistiniresistens]|uniref:hypothetical protein n=1 Tax=Acinetobacter colistiniresistens TaxID=280145 RepID=UPI00211C4F51|nr:hypothetical protein [Acinetobacter colistiniresistens]UUM28419.1 hypothetical protein NQU59_04695 [Acinetobacter colistiniresistens]
MKKILLLLLLSSLSCAALAKAPYRATADCRFDYDDFNFCSKQNIARYKSALAKQSPNFDVTKILLNVGSAQAIRYVVIDAETGIVFPLRDEILGFKDEKGGLNGKPALIQFSLQQPQLCIQGSVYAYRDAYDNVKVCYRMGKDSGLKYGQEVRRVDIPASLK